MEIALFVSGEKSIIGTSTDLRGKELLKMDHLAIGLTLTPLVGGFLGSIGSIIYAKSLMKGGSKIKQDYSVIESKLLFQDPDLFEKRFLYLIKEKFGISEYSEVSKIILALTGVVDCEKKMIHKSHILNGIALTKVYNGFRFSNNLGKIFGIEKILLLNDAFAIALGVRTLYGKLPTPVLVILIDIGIGVSFITETGSINAAEWGGEIIPGSMNKSPYQLIGGPSIDEIFFAGKVDVAKEYTQNLIKVINHISSLYRQNNPNFRSIFILSNKEEYINKNFLSENLKDYEIVFPKNIEEHYLIPLLGCYGYSDYLDSTRPKVTQIQYWSGEELIYDFSKYDDFVNHFKSAKPLAYAENYYKIYYSDKIVKQVKMKELNYESELDQYKF